MEEKIKLRNSKEKLNSKKKIDLSQLNQRAKLKTSFLDNNDLEKVSNQIKFNIKKEQFLQENFEKKYLKKYYKYINKEFNSKIISMLFNYISRYDIIPIPFKNSQDFVIEFLKIIQTLLINEIELVVITLIFDKIGLADKGLDFWKYIYFICLASKKISSSGKYYIILLRILNKYNSGFNAAYNIWINNSNIKKILENIKIYKINERFKELRQPNNITVNQKNFINYNEIAKKIAIMGQQKDYKEKNNLNLNILNNIQSNSNIGSNINYLPNSQAQGNLNISFESIPFLNYLSLPKKDLPSFGNPNKQVEFPQQSFEVHQNNSINNFLGLNGNNSNISYISGEED